MANVPVKVLFYVCGCGCKVPPEKIFKYKKTTNGETARRHLCPDHRTKDGRVVTLEMECQECGKIFQGKRALYCIECRKERKKARTRIYMGAFYKEHPEKHASFNGQRYFDGKRDYVNCVHFGDGICGKICIEPEFYCRARKSKKMKKAA